jgi:hypothetical protein
LAGKSHSRLISSHKLECNEAQSTKFPSDEEAEIDFYYPQIGVATGTGAISFGNTLVFQPVESSLNIRLAILKRIVLKKQ